MTYSSNPKHKSDRKSKKKEICQLAQDSFNAFAPFINVLDCGLKGWDGPFHLITKEDWRLHARHKAGERNLLHGDGEPFSSYRDVHCGIYSPWHVHQHIEEQETSYYTSGNKGLGLLYLDIDAHHPWQTDEYRAKAVLQKIFPSAYFRASNRGQNGYLKISYQSIREFNETADQLQATLQRLFLQLGILCDIEVKGTITRREKSGSLAKLPFTTRCPCHKRDETDSWNYPQLEKFMACSVTSLRNVQYRTRQLESIVEQDKVREFEKYKKSLADPEKAEQDEESKNKRSPVRRATSPAPTPPAVPIVPRPVSPTVHVVLPDAKSEDAFERNRQDIPPFVRAFWKANRRFPTTDETLDWIKANNRYSGEWEDRQRQRAKRVGQILRFTEQTFDSKKLSQGERQPVSLKMGRFSWWVRRTFGCAMTGGIVSLREFDPVAMTAPTTTLSVPAKFVETFLVVADFCLRHDPLENKAVPTNRIKALWKMVAGGAAWNQQYFQIVRDRLHRLGIIRIYDRHHHPGKAWRWEATDSFPDDDYRTEQRKLRERNRLRTGIAGSYRDLVATTKNIRNYQVHNTLYHDAGRISGLREEMAEGRAPP